MSTKNKLDKVAYVMLNIVAIITLILIAGIIGLGILGVYMAFNNAVIGGPMVLLMTILSVIVCPLLVGWIVQDILHLIGLIQYRKNNMIPARVLGVISSGLSMLSNLLLLFMCLRMSFDGDGEMTMWLVEIIILGICIIYTAIPFVLLIVSMCKKNKTI